MVKPTFHKALAKTSLKKWLLKSYISFYLRPRKLLQLMLQLHSKEDIKRHLRGVYQIARHTLGVRYAHLARLGCTSSLKASVLQECTHNCSLFSKADYDALGGQNPLGYAREPENTIYNFVGGGLLVADFNGDGEDDILSPDTDPRQALFWVG